MYSHVFRSLSAKVRDSIKRGSLWKELQRCILLAGIRKNMPGQSLTRIWSEISRLSRDYESRPAGPETGAYNAAFPG